MTNPLMQTLEKTPIVRIYIHHQILQTPKRKHEITIFIWQTEHTTHDYIFIFELWATDCVTVAALKGPMIAASNEMQTWLLRWLLRFSDALTSLLKIGVASVARSNDSLFCENLCYSSLPFAIPCLDCLALTMPRGWMANS